jgi:hypothetical protein
MALPQVKIDFINGSLGSVAPSADGVVGLLSSALAVANGLQLKTPYVLRKLGDLTALGVDSNSTGANATLYRHVKDFYDEAGEGAEMWLYCFAATVAPSAMLDWNAVDGGKVLLQASDRNIRVLGVNYAGAEGTVTNGISTHVTAALPVAQTFAKNATEQLYEPIAILIQGTGFNAAQITSLANLTENSYNRVGVLIGDTVSAASAASAAIGVLLGRVARIPVQRHIGRVADGALTPQSFYIQNQSAGTFDVTTLNDKGYITFRTFTGKAGYFFTDDSLATAYEDDYRSLARRRVIDKAYRIAYVTLLQFVNDEIPVTDEGKIPASTCKSWQNEVERAIETSMTTEGNLGADPSNANDTGVECWIDADQNVVATGIVEVNLRVKPFGYAKYIDVKLGFKATTA